MLSKEKYQRNLEKIENKLAFIKRAIDSDVTPEQKEWLRGQSVLYTSLFQALQANGTADEMGEEISQDLYTNIQKVKKKVINWQKFNNTDVEIFKKLKKEKGEDWVPLMDIIPPPPRITEIRHADLCDLSFPCISYTNEELCQFTEQIFKEQNLLTEFKIAPEKFSKLIQMICYEYNVPAYHSFSHGFNVFQMFYALIKKTELEQILDKTEVFASLLASLGHDMNHKGYNNAYESKLRTENAVLYCDNAILENMHASYLIRTLKDPELNFFDAFPDPAKKAQFKDLVTAVILATDMGKHNKLLQKFTENVKATVEYKRVKASGEPISKSLEEKAFLAERPHDKRRILKNIIHACDIGNPAQKYDRYIYWSALVSHEFDYQTQKEAKRGVEVTGFLKYKDPAAFYGGQIFFSKNLVLPLWEQIGILFEGAREAVENLNNNLKRLEEEKAIATAATAEVK